MKLKFKAAKKQWKIVLINVQTQVGSELLIDDFDEVQYSIDHVMDEFEVNEMKLHYINTEGIYYRIENMPILLGVFPPSQEALFGRVKSSPKN